jgi:hypothetical protein
MISMSNRNRAIVLGAVLSSLPVAARASTVYYDDSFNRTGSLDGSTPDVADTNANVWTHGNEPANYYQGNSGYANEASGTNYGGEFLPVNGTSGVTLDGSADFSLSAEIPAEGSSQYMGIGLNTATDNTGNQFASAGDPDSLGVVGIDNGGYAVSNFNHSTYTASFSASLWPAPETIAIDYSASANTLTFIANNKTLQTDTVSTAQIQNLEYVSIDNGSFGNNPGVHLTNFTLTVNSAATPEPASAGLLALGSTLLLTRRRGRHAGLASTPNRGELC